MLEETCCVTGHRDIPPDKLPYVHSQLEAVVFQAVADGYTRFLCGFAEGTDLLFAQIVRALHERDERIRLEAALPCRQRFYRLYEQEETRALLMACSFISIHSEQYAPYIYARRNRYMVLHASRVIAVYDGRPSGGTAATLRFARKQGRQLHLIHI